MPRHWDVNDCGHIWLTILGLSDFSTNFLTSLLFLIWIVNSMTFSHSWLISLTHKSIFTLHKPSAKHLDFQPLYPTKNETGGNNSTNSYEPNHCFRTFLHHCSSCKRNGVSNDKLSIFFYSLDPYSNILFTDVSRK